MRKRNAQRGSSIVEVFITAVVAVTALVATVAATLNGSRIAMSTAETRAATRAATTLVEQMRSTPYEELEETFGQQTFDVHALTGAETDATAQVFLQPVDTGHATWVVQEARINVDWGGSGGDRRISIVTYIGNGRGAVGGVAEVGASE